MKSKNQVFNGNIKIQILFRMLFFATFVSLIMGFVILSQMDAVVDERVSRTKTEIPSFIHKPFGQLNNTSIFTFVQTLAVDSASKGSVAYIHQRNAIESWKRMVLAENIIIVTSDDSCETSETVDFSIQCVNVEICKHSSEKMLMMNCIWELVTGFVQTEFVVFVNIDVIMIPSISYSMELASEQLDDFVLVGGKIDFSVDFLLDFQDPMLYKGFAERAQSSGKYFGVLGYDYWILKTSTMKTLSFPDSVIGEYSWDGFLLSLLLLDSDVAVVDCSETITAIHQKSPYPNADPRKYLHPEYAIRDKQLVRTH